MADKWLIEAQNDRDSDYTDLVSIHNYALAIKF